MGNQQGRKSLNDRTAAPRPGEGTVYSPKKYRETEGIKDYENVSGGSQAYLKYQYKTGPSNWVDGGSRSASELGGMWLYDSAGTARYQFTSYGGGGGGTPVKKHFLVKQQNTQIQPFALETEDIENESN